MSGFLNDLIVIKFEIDERVVNISVINMVFVNGSKSIIIVVVVCLYFYLGLFIKFE